MQLYCLKGRISSIFMGNIENDKLLLYNKNRIYIQKRGEAMKRLMKPNGLKLHLLRISNELNMTELAEKSHLSRRSIYQIEKGGLVTSLTAQKLANVYNVNIFDYFELIEK